MRHTSNSIELEVKIVVQHFELLMPLNQQAKKGVNVLAGINDPDYQRKIGLLLHNEGKEYVWNAGDPLECVSFFLSSFIEIIDI